MSLYLFFFFFGFDSYKRIIWTISVLHTNRFRIKSFTNLKSLISLNGRLMDSLKQHVGMTIIHSLYYKYMKSVIYEVVEHQ